MRRIPPVPTGYTFSTRQRTEQFQYFKIKSIQKQNKMNIVIFSMLPSLLFVSHEYLEMRCMSHMNLSDL